MRNAVVEAASQPFAQVNGHFGGYPGRGRALGGALGHYGCHRGTHGEARSRGVSRFRGVRSRVPKALRMPSDWSSDRLSSPLHPFRPLAPRTRTLELGRSNLNVARPKTHFHIADRETPLLPDVWHSPWRGGPAAHSPLVAPPNGPPRVVFSKGRRPARVYCCRVTRPRKQGHHASSRKRYALDPPRARRRTTTGTCPTGSGRSLSTGSCMRWRRRTTVIR